MQSGRQKPRWWWRSSAADDPITLEPIATLDCAPFELQGALFDARELARYMVTSGVLENPLTRVPLSREICVQLDAHRQRWRLLEEGDDQRVATIFDAQRVVNVVGANHAVARQPSYKRHHRL